MQVRLHAHRGQRNDEVIPGRAAIAGNRESPSWRTLRELLADGAITAPPTPVANRIAWRGRSTLLFAREKLGKSTLASAMIASVSNGSPFLTVPSVRGQVLYAIEEHPGDVALRLEGFGADLDNVCILDMLAVGDPIAEVERAAREIQPILIVVDTLSKLADIRGLKSGDSAEWSRLMSQLIRPARECGSALVVIHHAAKAGGYRDSTSIGASVDMILEMNDDSKPNCRSFKVKGRLRQAGDFSVKLHETEHGPCEPFYSIVQGERSKQEAIVQFLLEEPGATTNAVKEKVGGKSQLISALLKQMQSDGVIEDRDGAGKNAWYVACSGPNEIGDSLIGSADLGLGNRSTCPVAHMRGDKQ